MKKLTVNMLVVYLAINTLVLGAVYAQNHGESLNANLSPAKNVFINDADAGPIHAPRIIALAPHIVEILYDLGAGDLIIGTTDYADYPTQALEIPRVGNAIKLQLEKIVALKPDLIIAWKSGNPNNEIEQLQALGLKVIYSQPDTFNELAQEIRDWGQLIGYQPQANAIADQLSARFKTLQQRYINKAPVTVFYEIWPQPLTTIAKGAWPQRHLDLCGASNPFYQSMTSYPQVNIEHLILQPIQVIIQPVSTHTSQVARYDWQQWQHLPAVSNKQFLHPDSDALHRMTPRTLDEVAKLCASLDEVREFYQSN